MYSTDSKCVLVFIISAFISLSLAAEDDICKSNRGLQWRAEKDDCSTYYLCFNEVKFKYVCPQNFVRDLVSKACVPKGSDNDKCSSGEEDVCNTGEERMPRIAGSCATYVDCITYRTPGASKESALNECEYPMVFDLNSKRCQPHEIADCGGRKVPKSPCDYEANMCSGPNCRPCHVRFPSCEGMEDGLNKWIGRDMSPYYVVCKNERVVFQGMCSNEKSVRIFDEKQRMCVEAKQ